MLRHQMLIKGVKMGSRAMFIFGLAGLLLGACTPATQLSTTIETSEPTDSPQPTQEPTIMETSGILPGTELEDQDNEEGDKILFSIPMGADGIHYEGAGQADTLTWGPAAFTVAPDGSFWIADTAGNQLLHYDPKGVLLDKINVEGIVVCACDIEVTSNEIWILDTASQPPKVVRLAFDGLILDSDNLPAGLQLENGLSGIALGEDDQVLIECEGGYKVTQFLDANGEPVDLITTNGYMHDGKLFAGEANGLQSTAPKSGKIIAGSKTIEVETEHDLGGIRILGFGSKDDFFVILDELASDSDNRLQVDETVRRYNFSGELLGLARAPIADQYTQVDHGLAVGKDGSVYFLVTRPDRIEVWRLHFNTHLEPILFFETPISKPSPTTPSTTRTAPVPKPTNTPHITDPNDPCSAVERLALDSPEAQQIVEEFTQNYKMKYPTELMNMSILHRVDRLGEWAVVQGSVSGEGKDVIAVRKTTDGYQMAERYIITAPLESFDEPEKIVPQYFMEKLPEVEKALFTCMNQSWLLGRADETEAASVYQLAYLGTSDDTTDGETEINSIQSDGSNHKVLLREPMMILNMVYSPDGEKIAFWGCPGSIANDCSIGEDLDVWAVNWDGSNLSNLTEDSALNDTHPDWSPDGDQIVFQSDRTGKDQIFIMQADGSGVRQLTDEQTYNREPKWSPDGKWIAYHCRLEGETRICVVSPDGQPAGEPIDGLTPTWSPVGTEDEMRLAFRCMQDGQEDICTARADGSDLVNLTNSPGWEHSYAWSPDGNWLAFVLNNAGKINIFKICVTCPGEHVLVRLTDELYSPDKPVWSPDGSRVAYKVFTGTMNELMIVNADRSDATYLISDVFSLPIWRPQQ